MIKWFFKFVTGEFFRLSFTGGGGGQQQQPQPTTTTQTMSNLPAWAQPYSEQLLGKAQALTDTNTNPYESYTGDRLAGFTPMQQQAFQNIGGMQVSPQTGQATGLAGLAGMGSMGAGANYMNMATNPAAIQAFMSPYQQNVTDWQKQQAISDYGRQLPGLGAGASQAGAFGGTRHALVESEAQRNLQNQLAGIQAQGSQNAFNAAQQAQQFGAGLGLQGYGQALQSANTLGQLGQQQYQQQMGINAAQQQAGAQQQAMNQQQLTNQYQDFLNRQNYPYQQLAFMSDILHGTPTGGVTTQQQYQATPSLWSNIGGLGQLAGGIGALYKSGIFGKEGGSVPGGLKSYASGGSVNPLNRLMSPNFSAGVDYETRAAQQGQPTMLPPIDLAQLSQVKQEVQRPSGIAGLPAPNLDQEQTFNAARGGIIAFAGEGPSLVGENLIVDSEGYPIGEATAETKPRVLETKEQQAQRQKIINERIAARDAARASAEAAGKPPVLETVGTDDVAMKRLQEQQAKRLAAARGAGLGATPEAVSAGKTAADLEIEKALGKTKPGIAGAAESAASTAPKTGIASAAESAASTAPKTGIAGAAGAAESAAAGAAKKQAAQSGLRGLLGRAGNFLTPKSLLGRAGGLGTAGMVGYEIGEAANRAGAQEAISDATEGMAFGDAGARAIAPSVLSARSGNDVFNVIAYGETGGKWDSMGSLGQVVKDTNNSRSYGSFGFNSQGGKNSTAGRFAAAYPELGLKGEPGTAEFTSSWKSATAKIPEKMAAAQKDFAQQNFIAPVVTDISKLGVPTNVAKDPRVVAYFADRNIQLGGMQTPENIKKAWEQSKGNIPAFLTKVNESDQKNLEALFPNALAQGRYSEEAHANRLNKRLMGALNIGSTTTAAVTADGRTALDRAADVVRRGRETAVKTAKEFVSPGSTYAEEAVATQMRDPNTGKIVNVLPDVPPLNKPDNTSAADDAKKQLEINAGNRAMEKAREAQTRGDKENADKWFNIGMALLASGSATLGARGAEAQGFGPLAAGIKAGMPVFAELSKQDKAERLRRQQLAETERAHRATEANNRYRIFESGIQAAAKRAFPTFDTMTPSEQAQAETVMRIRYIKSLPAEEQQALGYSPEFIRQQEGMLSAVPSGNRMKFDASGNPIK